MPSYKVPLFKNVAINVLEKTKAFVFGAGKIILALSVILWLEVCIGIGATARSEMMPVQKSYLRIFATLKGVWEQLLN